MSKYGGDLPEEMIREVLIRLPVKSLLVCKSVCKPWLSTITNPDFVKSQLHHAIIASQNNPTLLGLEAPSYRPFMPNMGGDEFGLLEFEQEEQLRLQHLFEALLDVNRQYLSASPICIHRVIGIIGTKKEVYGSYNGIVCVVVNSDDDISLWNPSIRQCKKLPTPPNNSTTHFVSGFGFGYDSISDDYNVIRFFYNLHLVPSLQVYSYTADSWTEFQHPLFGKELGYLEDNIVVNGVLYYTTHLGNLVSFDLHKQVFLLVPFPTSIQTRKSALLDFKGSFAVVFESDSELHLWTLDDVSGKVSWTKRFSIEDDSKLDMWLTCYLGAGLFFGTKYIITKKTYLYNFVYDYEKKETKYYQLGENNIYWTFNYTETLISLDGFEQVQSLDRFCTSGVKWQRLN